jgi:hypothetical protein
MRNAAMAMKNEVNIGLIITIGAASALLLLIVLVGAQAGFLYAENGELLRKWDMSKNEALKTARDDQTAHISHKAVVDADKGIYAIPINQAMEIVAQQKGNVTFATGK